MTQEARRDLLHRLFITHRNGNERVRNRDPAS